MRMTLEIFWSKPPAHRREIIARKTVVCENGGDEAIKELIAFGESRQSDAEHIFYHILFDEQPANKKETSDGKSTEAATV